MSRTKKPCPGCGEVSPRRAADEVCHECAKKLREHKELSESIEKLAAKKKTKIVAMPFHYELPYFKNCSPHQGPNFQIMFYDLVLASAVEYFPEQNKNPQSRYGDFKTDLAGAGKERESFHQKQKSSRGDLVINKDTLLALRSFYDQMEAYAAAVYENGLSDGTDLLGKMIRGEIKAEEINAAQLEAKA